ncbi:MAG: hypothetical protein FJZ01_06975 [Candidatus Sericytochromatia bacterium]|nr:hypothetical protein [Candidatus Tanganyikabacteria bacterium]
MVNLTTENSINVKIKAADAASLGVQAADLKVDNKDNATGALVRLDKAIENVATIRSQIGTGIERLTHSINSLGVTTATAQDSQSVIRELDTAKESVRLARDRIMSDSSRAMFVQANKLASLVLDLFK